jgi:hypothetical protein
MSHRESSTSRTIDASIVPPSSTWQTSGSSLSLTNGPPGSSLTATPTHCAPAPSGRASDGARAVKYMT